METTKIASVRWPGCGGPIHPAPSIAQDAEARSEAPLLAGLLFWKQSQPLAFAPSSNPLSDHATRVGASAFNIGWISSKEAAMDWNRIEGNWKQFGGRVKEKWGKLTDDDLAVINGRRDQLEGKIQERYGLAKDQVRSDIDTWLKSLP